MRRFWTSNRGTLLACAVVVMAAAALLWLGYESYRFFRQPERIGSTPIHPGAIDLRIFHSVVTTWFSGKSLFTGDTSMHAVYPPASMVFMWLVYGWKSLAASTSAWLVTVVAAVAWLVRTSIRESGADTPVERAFVALIPLAIYPTGAAIGNGQMSPHVIALLLAGLLRLRDGPKPWRSDLLAALLILFALAKPTLVAPFFWIVILSARSLRPAIIVCVLYVAATLFAVSFQEQGTIELFRQLLAGASSLSTRAGESNVHALLVYLGHPEWIFTASLAALLLFGIWVWRHRRCDYWLLLGVAGFVARFWFYHRWYDDLLILLPMITLFRLAKCGPSAGNRDVVAGSLFALTLIFMLAPGGRYLLPAHWNGIWTGLQVAAWLADFVFLLLVAHRAVAERKQMAQCPDVTFIPDRRTNP